MRRFSLMLLSLGCNLFPFLSVFVDGPTSFGSGEFSGRRNERGNVSNACEGF